MSVVELSLVLILLLFAVLGTGVWIAIALAVCGFAAVMTKVSTPAGSLPPAASPFRSTTKAGAR